MNDNTFKLETLDDVKLFTQRLESYQKSRIQFPLFYVNLEKAFIELQNNPEGGRIFTALLDLKLTFTMLYIDLIKAGGIWNENFSVGKLSGGSALDSQAKFDGKSDLHYYYTNFIPRYRAIWDKIFGIFILLFSPEHYEKFRKAKSRKREFEKLSKIIPQIPVQFVKDAIQGLSLFDEKFRTPEMHGTGTLRKWSFTMLSLHKTPTIELSNYWNSLLRVLGEIDRIVANEK